MKKQVWTFKLAQDVKAGDIIASQFAMEVRTVEIEGDTITVECYADKYRRFFQKFQMEKNQSIPVAVSGIAHMDKITGYSIARGSVEKGF